MLSPPVTSTKKRLFEEAGYTKFTGYAEMFIKSLRFPESDVENFDLVPVVLNTAVRSAHVTEEFDECQLMRPLPHDALRLRECCNDLQRSSPIVLLHMPWLAPDGCFYILSSYKMCLNMTLYSGRWRKDCIFIARRYRV